jgi:hypothetical protein
LHYLSKVSRNFPWVDSVSVISCFGTSGCWFTGFLGSLWSAGSAPCMNSWIRRTGFLISWLLISWWGDGQSQGSGPVRLRFWTQLCDQLIVEVLRAVFLWWYMVVWKPFCLTRVSEWQTQCQGAETAGADYYMSRPLSVKILYFKLIVCSIEYF